MNSFSNSVPQAPVYIFFNRYYIGFFLNDIYGTGFNNLSNGISLQNGASSERIKEHCKRWSVR